MACNCCPISPVDDAGFGMKGLLKPLLILVAITLAGTVGYMYLEHWSLTESLYQIVITLSTVGFREVRTLSPAGRALTMVVIVFGIATAAYLVRRIVEFTVEGELVGERRRRKMSKTLDRIKDHYIVCGFGQVGRWVVNEFQNEQAPFVVIDDDPRIEPELVERGFLYVIGNASSDDVLLAAGIDRAAGLVAVTDTDAENVFVTISARALNPELRIVSRANDSDTEGKLVRAGAEGVLCPRRIAGSRIASMLLHPATTGFLDTVIRRGQEELRIEDLLIREGSPLAGLTLQGAEIRAKSGAMVVGIRRRSGGSDLNPAPDTVISPGDRLIALGTRSQLSRLEQMI